MSLKYAQIIKFHLSTLGFFTPSAECLLWTHLAQNWSISEKSVDVVKDYFFCLISQEMVNNIVYQNILIRWKSQVYYIRIDSMYILYKCIYIYLCVSSQSILYVGICMHSIQIYICVHLHVYMIYIYMYICKNIYIYTYIYILK